MPGISGYTSERWDHTSGRGKSAEEIQAELVRKGWTEAGVTGYGESAWTHKDGWSAVHCHRSYWGHGKSGLAVRAQDGTYFYLPFEDDKGWALYPTDLLP